MYYCAHCGSLTVPGVRCSCGGPRDRHCWRCGQEFCVCHLQPPGEEILGSCYCAHCGDYRVAGGLPCHCGGPRDGYCWECGQEEKFCDCESKRREKKRRERLC